MTALTEVFVTVKPDTDKFGPEVKKKLARIDASKEGKQVATRFGVGLNGAMGSIVSKSAGIFAAGFAVIQGAKVFGGFIKEAAESEKISRITANAIRATGGAAKISADQVSALATSISNKTAIDDEQIQSAANMLLTFKNIRNETGKGNDVFNQATQAAADLSVQFGGIDGASKQLGKALNDPIKGTTALAKAGVTFTQQQKDQIATLVKSGDTLGAQKIILKEIQGQVGGAAAAAADPMARLQVVAGNLGESIGGLLLPTVNKFATFVTETAVPGIYALGAAFQGEGVTSDGFVGFMERVGVAARAAFGFFKTEVLPRLRDFAGFVTGTVVPAVSNLIASFRPLAQDVGTAAVGVFEKIAPVAKDFGAFLKDTVVPAVVDFTKWLKDNSTIVGAMVVGVTAMTVAFKGYHLALAIAAAATKAYAAVQAALNFVMNLNPIGIIVLALVGLAAGLVYAYKKSETFRNILQGVFGGIQKAAQTFAPVVKAAIGVVIAVFSLWWNYYAKPILKAFWEALKFAWGYAQKFATIVTAGFNAIKEPARAAIAFVIGRFLDFVGAILTGAAKAFGWVPQLGGKLKAAATEFGKFRDSVNGKLAGITDQQINFTIKYSNTGVNLSTPSSVGRRASGGPGGPIDGPGTTTSDTAGLYALSRKEWVIKAKSSMKYGDHAMASVNAGTATIIPDGGFAAGGRPGLNPKLIADSSGLAKSVRSVVIASAAAAAKAIAKSGGGLAGTMAFGRSQVGKPYVWGGVGPGGYDCSGFVSALINYSRGRNPYRRLGATGSMPWGEFQSGTGPFMVGWFKGNPGHTAATINGVNFESRGGRGVVAGSAARGAYDGLFTNRAKVKGFAGGGKVGDAPFDLLDPRGKDFAGRNFLKQLGVGVYDRGGPWPTGTLGYNGSGKTEHVVPGDGTIKLHPDSVNAIADAVAARPTILNDVRLDEGMSRGSLRRGM